MRLLISFLILFFIILISYQILSSFNSIEGYQDTTPPVSGVSSAPSTDTTTTTPSTTTNTVGGIYQPYSGNATGTLEQQNASNIQVLEQQVNTLQTQVQSLATAQTSAISKQTTPTPAPTPVPVVKKVVVKKTTASNK